MQVLGWKKSVSRRNDKFISELMKNKILYLMILPGVIYFLIFNYAPLVGVYFAFVDYKPLSGPFGFGSEFVGLKNFEFFFGSGMWLKITFNTLFLNALFIFTGLMLQIFMAVMLNEIGNKYFKKITQSFMFLPNFLSWTVVSVFALALFGTSDGLINSLLGTLGFDPIPFYQMAKPWPVLLVMLRLWKGVGYGTVIYLAAITGIGQEMYEAARVDGASRLKQIIHITIPMLKTTTVVLLILSVGSIFFGDFGMIYALLGDNPLVRPTTDVIDTFVFRALRMKNDIGMSTAVGLAQSLLGLLMAVGANFIAKKIDEDSTIF